jgi:2-methylisocitrate lyase-like PEP mutase family enzyme
LVGSGNGWIGPTADRYAAVVTQNTDLAKHFLELHRKGQPLLLANAWDAGTARLLASLGFDALATTSAGHAGTLGRLDGRVTRDEALAHARELAAAIPLPVNADLEHCFADAPEGVAETIRLASGTGLAGGSIEDFSGDPETAIYPAELATARVQAAAEAAHASAGFVLTARCENYLHGRRDLADTIARLQSFQSAGADVLYAPGLTDLEEIRSLVAAVDAPVNVLCMPGGPTVAELASVGVARISVGSAFFNVAMGAVAEAAREWREQGTHAFWKGAIVGMGATKPVFAG